jgi:glyoxylase-like metal-dependent hydrolase (beta-lactamase superfamily II)
MAVEVGRDYEPRYGEAVTIAPGIRRITANNPGPFTFHGTNTFLVGDRDIAVIDPGPDDPAHVDALMRTLGGARVAKVLVTHSHADHCAAAALLKQRTGAPILAAVPARSPKAADDGSLDAGAASGFAPDIELTDGESIDGGGCIFQAIATPGHAADHLVFALGGRDLLFSGDHVMGWSTTVVAPPDGSMADYMRSLNRLLDRSEDVYLPTHGGAIPNARAHVRTLRNHRLMRERAILERLRLGDRRVEEIVRNLYVGLDAELLGAAAMSTLAHLEDLVARKLAAADGPPTLAAIYSAGGDGSSGAEGSTATTPGETEGVSGTG